MSGRTLVKAVRIALVSASAWSALLVVAALTVPVYSGETSSADSTGEVSSSPTTATLVEVNGAWGLVVASIPLLACAVVGALLLRPGGRTRQVIAAVVVGLLGILTVVSLLTVGVFVAPATAGLGVAVLLALASPTERHGMGAA
ncbi:hypothetical protein BJ986_002169 [Phycicoccus badiiscoriae]|uniref:Uncharacterized protein n=1 Tax=Pedococcus badiiscoriae TaxID=642776 RepID=A0A852WR45_9MICO|nr:hypothetical protein [Pedococcus badiiscoriae]NYG07682.1 hypothetical protein [Pedococcus badiiscoriae]